MVLESLMTMICYTLVLSIYWRVPVCSKNRTGNNRQEVLRVVPITKHYTSHATTHAEAHQISLVNRELLNFRRSTVSRQPQPLTFTPSGVCAIPIILQPAQKSTPCL
jgi:hypothetical protein